MIDTQRRPRQAQSTNIDLRDLGDEFLAYDRESKQVHVLNSTAREIYSYSNGTRTIAEIGVEIADDYGIDREVVLRDLVVTLERLGALGLIEFE